MKKNLIEYHDWTIRETGPNELSIFDPEDIHDHIITYISRVPSEERLERILKDHIALTRPISSWPLEVKRMVEDRENKSMLNRKKREQEAIERNKREKEQIENSFHLVYPEGTEDIQDLIDYLAHQKSKGATKVALRIQWDYHDIESVRLEPLTPLS